MKKAKELDEATIKLLADIGDQLPLLCYKSSGKEPAELRQKIITFLNKRINAKKEGKTY